MGETKATSLGSCGLCGRQIDQMTPIGHVLLGVPKTPYLAHKGCADDSRAPTPAETLVVSTPAEISPESFPGDVEPVAPPPVREQRGRRKKTEDSED